MKFTCVVLCALIAVSVGDFASYETDNDDYYDYSDVKDASSKETLNESSDVKAVPIDNDNQDKEKKDGEDVIDDYQIEDNRSDEKSANDDPLEDGEPIPDDGDVVEAAKSEEKEANDEPLLEDEEPIPDDGDVMEIVNSEEKDANDDTPLEDGEPIPDDGDAMDPENAEKDASIEGVGEVPVEAEEPQASDESDDDDAALDDDSWGDIVENEEEPLPVPADDETNKIFEETREILEGDLANEFDDHQPAEEAVNEEPKESQEEIQDMIKKIQMILDEANDYDEQDAKSDEDVFSENKEESDSEEDTADKVYSDLNADLDKLFEVFDKLNDDEPEAKESDEVKVNNVKDYEEKFGWPYKEADILGQRMDDYESIEDSNLSEIFKEAAEDTAAEDVDSNENDNDANEMDIPDGDSDMANENSNNDENTVEKSAEKTAIEPVVEGVNAEIVEEEKKPSEEDEIDYDSSEENEEEIESLFPEKQPYGEDGLVDETKSKEIEAEEILKYITNYENGLDDAKDIDNVDKVETTQKSISVDELDDAQLDDLMEQFKIAHQEDLDTSSDDFHKFVSPIHITLSDEPVVISSPNYPAPYPTNNIIDWTIEVDGSGIELNVTDLAMNGAMGDYLLIKPGGLDESGHEGLVFSYRLDSERRYRFLDVDRMFIRFEAKLALPMLSSRGFQLSMRKIFDPVVEPEPEPEPEPVVQPPVHTLTLNLAGLTLPEFRLVQEDFLHLVAKMADEYINLNEIYYGYNSTLEVAQITRTAVCSIHWPNYETCVEVTFGVPLNYGDEDLEQRLNAEDLEDMWNSLIGKDQFASLLSAMGIKEYVIPNDRTVLTVWLVIAAGVLLSVAMLAFALWRFSCFEDYTRMRAFSDTDSIRNEKKNLDLYPTPHQTLPPLYAESEYKWADDKYDDSTRVDMGGFANKSYARDELYFDSDEDVIAPRDRQGAISSKDIYSV